MNATTAADIFALYERWGNEFYDEKVSQTDHARQTAALARSTGAPDYLIAAALLHDVGHLLDIEKLGSAPPDLETNLNHENTGAEYLSQIFSTAVTAPITQHVEAKRFLCATDSAYLTRLSEGSQRSLIGQGGVMNRAAVSGFLDRLGAADAVALRGWDDHAKVEGLEIAPLSDYRELLENLSVTG